MRETGKSKRFERIGAPVRRRGILPLLLLAAFCLRGTTLWLPHEENDEVIYTYLAKRVWKEPLRYNLQGSPLLEVLPLRTYDRPIHFHPPLFVYSLAVVGGRIGWRWLAMLPVLAGVGTVALVYGTSRMESGRGEALWACALAAFCPIGWFGSTKIWIEPCLTFCLALTFFFGKKAAMRDRVGPSFLSGIFLGLALLYKLSALLMIPCLLFMSLCLGRNRWRRLLAWSLPALMLFLPWLMVFYRTSGVLFPYWFRFDEAALKAFPFVAAGYAQPPTYYLGLILTVAPVYLFAIPGSWLSWKEKRGLAEIGWVLSLFGGFTLLGFWGAGYFTRFIIPAFPPLAILSARAIASGRRSVLFLAAGLLGYGLLNGVYNIVLHWSPDLYPLTSYLLPTQ